MTNPFKPISRVNLHSEVMQQITAAIQSGQWKPGSKLPGEIALAEMFQVSRTCIREVLKALAYSGVVESRSGVGTFVKEIPSEAPSPAVDLLSSTDYTQILEMRKLLEGQAAYWATERATPEEIAAVIEPQFPETDLETITTIVTRYYDQDTWKSNLIFEESSFDLLQDILESAGELEERVPYDDLVTTKFVAAAAQ